MNELRSAIRARFGYCCGYCGITEISAGSELEIDHFQPRSQGGPDSINNLIYACAACNRNKADYWPSPETPSHRQLLHPLEDDLTSHIRSLENGQLEGVTQRGQFHIEWLHLNRPQLILHRQDQFLQAAIQKTISQLHSSNQQLQQEIFQQREELADLNQRIRRLQNRS